MAKATYKVGSMEVSVGGPMPEVKPGEKLVRRTASVCPVCYRLIPAIIVERDGKLYIRKVCPEHGETEELYRGTRVDMYEKFMKFYITRKYLQKPIYDEGRPCPYNCGLCPLHLSHTGLMNIVVTNRCDLSCRYCFPRDEKAVFKLDDEVFVATFEDVSKKLQELGYNYDYKVRIDGFEGEYIIPEGLYVLTFDRGKAKRTRVTKFLRRHHKGEVYVIKTGTGRRIRTTPEHKYFVYEDGKLVKKRADELKIGDKVVVLRNYPNEVLEEVEEVAGVVSAGAQLLLVSSAQKLGDFYIDEIVEISTYEYDGYVYDLEVEHKMHAFVAGEGLLVSNCFFYAERAGFVYEPTIEQIREMIRTAHKQGLRAKAIQLTGGEPTMRDDLVDIVRAVREEGITHVQLNSHIIRLAYDAELTRRLREAGVNTVYMSFDGVTPNVNTKNHREVPYFFENARKAKMTSIVLVPTVIRGRNTDQLGAIIEFAARNMDIVRSVNFQPVSLVGQMKKHEREKYRITIPEVIKLIEEQTNGQIPVEARYPVPAAAVISDFIAALSGEPQPAFTSHPVCGAGTYVYVERKGDEIKYIPITHFVDVDGLLERMREVTEDLMTGRKSKSRFLVKGLYELEKFIDKRKQPKGIDLVRMLYQIVVRHDYSTLGEFHYRFLFLGMMHFQDPYNYDVDRVRRCVIHYGTPDGRVIPFCAFNVFPELYRDYIQKEFSIPLEEREKKHGKTKKYVRTQEMIKKLESGEPYIKHYKPFMHLRKK